jgi:enediyne biosynthesis protein E4
MANFRPKIIVVEKVMISMNRLNLIGVIFYLCACTAKKELQYTAPADALFVKLDAAQTGVGFTNTVADQQDYNILTYRNFYNGGGVAIGDINNDGLPDIFFTANLGDSKLYLNKGNFKFEDITAATGIKSKRGWRTGVTMADVNSDGWLDIYVCNSGDIKGDNKENELYINLHNNTFIEQAKAYGLNDPGYTTHVSFFDYDLDGDLDCYILNNSFVDVRKFDLEAVRKIRDTLGGHKLMRNDNGHFTDVSEQAGIAGTKIAYGLGVSVGDVNGDMYPDIYVSNDFYEKDYLYINQKNGTFKDELPERMGHISSSSMGADIADLNNDGCMDIVTTDMLPEAETRVKTLTRFEQYHVENMKYRFSFHYQYPQNALQLNNGDGSFSETAFLSGIAATDWSWGALMFDFDNDGYKDIYISNGVYKDISDMDFSDFLANKQNISKVVSAKDHFDFRDFLSYIPSNKLANYAYVNQRNLTFANKANELGFGEPSFSNGVAYADLDNDGDMDLVVNNINSPCFIYRNETNKKSGNHYLKINFKGEEKNPFGTGAWVNLYANNQKQVLQNIPVRSFESCVDNKLVFGLGKNAAIDSLEVIWPNLKRQVLYNVKPDQQLVLNQKDADKNFVVPVQSSKIFTDKTATVLNSPVKHTENIFSDFGAEILLPYMLSTQGPKMAEADVNNDGLTDIFIGGAIGDPGKIVLQQGNGFNYKTQTVFETDKGMEDAGAAFFDVDKDGDMDLLVASGGYQYDQGSSLLLARLYINDGKGNFSKGTMPAISTNASCVRVADFDKDGFADVFIGGRAVAGRYGLPGRSYLLHNKNGILVDETPAPLKEPGMVTDAVWNDINNDGYPDLMLVGDWMPVTCFINNKGSLSQKNSIANSSGLWNCITASDVDKDGDTDFILGNWGYNTQFKASPEKPMDMYVNDFDANGSTDAIISYYWPDGKSHLYNSKIDLTAQLPFLKKKVLLYKDYAGKSVNDIIGDALLGKSAKLSIQTLASSVMINGSGGTKGQETKINFTLLPLPQAAQIAPVFATLADDYDKDGNIDIFAAGNFWDIKPDIGRLDGNATCFLHGDGKGGFSFVSNIKSGLNIKGQVRDAAAITIANKKMIILARNNDGIIFLQPQ